MPEHYTRKTFECTAWCKTCGRNTQHRVDHPEAPGEGRSGGKGGGRRGPCLEHEAPKYSHAQCVRMGKERKRKRLEEEAKRQPSLF